MKTQDIPLCLAASFRNLAGSVFALVGIFSVSHGELLHSNRRAQLITAAPRFPI
jgi:hypothetical protein